MKISNIRFLIYLIIIAGLLLMTAVTAETNAATDLNKPSITVSVSPSTPKVGDTVVISGLAKGGNLTPGISMWIFAGNYVNITNVPVNGTGFYSKSVNTAEFPPAYYYIFIQHPGSDSRFNINPRGYSGEVVNTNTGAVIFNFTGTGSVNDNAAAIALSTAFNTVGVDDVFSKTGVQLLPAVSGATVSTPTHNGIQATIAVATTSQTRESKPLSTVAATALPTNSLAPGAALTTAIPATTKAPLSIISFVLGIGIVVTGIVLRRKN